MSNIRLYLVAGLWWLGCEQAGRLLLITKLGKVGSRIRP